MKYCLDERFVNKHLQLLMSYFIPKKSKKLNQFIE